MSKLKVIKVKNTNLFPLIYQKIERIKLNQITENMNEKVDVLYKPISRLI
ncbi:MAG: hypothetical protein WCK02_15780 [Bacteroidota bacterium]